jgi:6-phosphofructokinase
MRTKKGLIGILTGGGDVPGLNPAIRAVTIRALREGYQVAGIRHGWLGAMSIVRDEQADNSEHFQILTEEIVNRAARTGGTARISRVRSKLLTYVSTAEPNRTDFKGRSQKTWIGIPPSSGQKAGPWED